MVLGRDVCGSAVRVVNCAPTLYFCLGLCSLPAVAGSFPCATALLAGLSLAAANRLLTVAGPSLGWVAAGTLLATVGEALLSPLGMDT